MQQKGVTTVAVGIVVVAIILGVVVAWFLMERLTEEGGEVSEIDFGGVTSAIAVGHDKIDIEWTPLTPAENYFYRVYISTTSGAQNFDTPAFSTAFGASSCRLTGLEAGTTYYIVVRAFLASGDSVDTNTVEAHTTTETNEGWEVEHVDDSVDDVGLYTCLKVDSSDNWNIFYTNATDNQIWMVGPEAAPPYFMPRPFSKSGLTYRPFVDIADDDHFELVYYSISDNALYFAEQTIKDIGVSGTYCDTQITSGEAGRHASMKIDSSGNRLVAFYDSESGDLKYVEISSDGTVGTVSTVDSDGNVGQYCSLAIDPSTDLPRVSYYDATNQDLKYAVKMADGSWTVQTIDSNGDVGRYSSLAIDSSGAAYVAYHDASAKSLKLATKDGAAWTIENIDNEGNVGEYCSLALDPQGNLGISYYDATNGDLKYAKGKSGLWSIQTVVANDDVGRYSSLGFTSNERAVISYYDASRGDLWVAREI